METVNESPLKKYRRQPKIFIDLPSKGKWYFNNTVYNNVYTQLPVFSMTASDEILFKTPDALINGQATASNIKSCCPAILDPWKIKTIDLDTVLIAIRIATYGPKINVNHKCPHCKNENAYEIPLQNLLNHYLSLNYEDTLIIDNFIIKLQPLNYQQMTEMQKKTVALQRTLNMQLRRTDFENDSQKEQIIDSLITQIAEVTVQIIFMNIESVEVDGVKETNTIEIMEWLKNNDVKIFKGIKTHIEKNAEIWQLPLQKVKCVNCDKENQIRVNLDQSDFFVTG